MLERKTIISTQVLTLLEASSAPLSVAQIMTSLEKKNLTPNKTTIYRILEKLIQKKIVSKITIRDGTTYFEFAQSQHHHHFICIQCDAVFCLPTCHVESHQINLDSFLPNPKFKIKSHDFNLYGICAPCVE